MQEEGDNVKISQSCHLRSAQRFITFVHLEYKQTRIKTDIFYDHPLNQI